CVMGPGPLPLAQVGAKLERFLPMAAAALAVDAPRVELHRQPVDWGVIINATLHRLHGRLARYLVLVHVDPGRIEADALLLADAIAHVIEEVLDRTPPQTPVRLVVRRRPEGWHFQVETEHPPSSQDALPRPGLLLARQVVSAHGGAWEQVEGRAAAYRVGFTLPADGGRHHGAVDHQREV
ncbi:MAG: Two-component system sensor histidine kinase KdbD, partial [Cyanobacteria bacterium RYN_339]|nr:Two-component system sensor histidine kinase KdbD [Cyanobacteria bacterium RYN_339]